MIDLALHAADEAAMRKALRPLGYLSFDEAGAEGWRQASRSHALVVIGAEVLTRPVLDWADRLVAAAELRPGFRLDLRLFGEGAEAAAASVLAASGVSAVNDPRGIWL